MAHDARLINQEGAAQGDALVRMLNAVGFLHFAFDIRHHRILHRPDAAFLHRGITPGVVDKFRVKRDADHFDAALLKLFVAFIEGDQL